jgi:hypothetical protein
MRGGMAGYVSGYGQQPPGKQHMGTAIRTATTSPASWDAFSDVDAFVDAVLAELAAMAADGTRPTRSGPKPPLAGAALRKAIMALWCVCFCGMQWRAIGQLCDIPLGTLDTLFARWTRLGLWRRLLDRLIRTWRLACGDAPEPSAVMIDSRSCRSAPSCFGRGIDGGKKIKGSCKGRMKLPQMWRVKNPQTVYQVINRCLSEWRSFSAAAPGGVVEVARC